MIVRKWTSVLVHSAEDLIGVAVRRRYPVWGSELYGYSFTFFIALLYYVYCYKGAPPNFNPNVHVFLSRKVGNQKIVQVRGKPVAQIQD